MIVYVDTSVLAKTLIAEANSDAVVTALDAYLEHERLFSSSIVITEVHRVTMRADVGVASAWNVIRRLSLVQLNDELLTAAGQIPGASLRSLDAIHIASAIWIEADVFVTADVRQASAARTAGLGVVDRFD